MGYKVKNRKRIRTDKARSPWRRGWSIKETAPQDPIKPYRNVSPDRRRRRDPRVPAGVLRHRPVPDQECSDPVRRRGYRTEDSVDSLTNLMIEKSLAPNTHVAGFIGNLEIGRRYPDETIFRRVIGFNNPTSTVQSNTLTLTVNNGILHYISVVNDSGSYAVVCDEPNTLGSSRGNINIRASANTKSYLTIVAAVH